jgi:hypothetical protein
MSKTIVLAALLAAAGAVADAQTVDEIVARNAGARGGAAAWRAVQSMKCSGSMDVGRGVQVPFRLELKRPRKMRLEFDFAGSTTVQTYDGVAGWTLAPYAGRSEAQPFSAEELKAASAQAELDGALIDYAAKGSRLELVGREMVEGREAFKLALTPRDGSRRYVYVDVESGLEVEVESSRQLRGEEKPVRTYFRDYRSVGGLLVPHLLETRIEGAPRSHALKITSVVLDVPVPEARFARPSSAGDRVERQAKAAPGAGR